MAFFEVISEDQARCTLCPHLCIIKNNKKGICSVREFKHPDLNLPYYGYISSMGVDPIEKKPLYHFYPGKDIFSIGFFGCNLQCPFCQNYTISDCFSDSTYNYRSMQNNVKLISPQEVVNQALKYNSFGIAYTYSEPLIHFEFIMECADIATKKGLKNIIVTNGFINREPAGQLFSCMDAANIDLKGFTETFYRSELKGKLQPVLDTISLAAQKVLLEITTLVIPGKNSSTEEISEIAHFIAGLDPVIPLHLTRYYPTHNYDLPPTSTTMLMNLVEVARTYLHFVYPGNVGSTPTNTYCPNCKNLLIERKGYEVVLSGITGNSCTACNYLLPFPIT